MANREAIMNKKIAAFPEVVFASMLSLAAISETPMIRGVCVFLKQTEVNFDNGRMISNGNRRPFFH